MKIFDMFLLLLSVAAGFFLGLFFIAMFDVFEVGGWVGLLVGLAVVLLFSLFLKMTDIPSEWLFDKFTPQGNTKQLHEPKTATRIANAVGVVAAFGATQIWTIDQIMALL